MRKLTLAAPAALSAALLAGPALAADWTGFYAGGQVGYGDISNDLNGYGNFAGVHAGYMFDYGTYVLGAEVDYDAADLEIFGGPAAIESVARLKLRAGYDTGPALLYATAGAANADVGGGGVNLSDTGWFAGVGVAYELPGNWMVGGEVLGHRFDNFDNTGLDVDVTTVSLRASFRF